jgi:hypothetical protein
LAATLALLVGVTVQTAQATAVRTAQLRARSCCVGKCRRMDSLGRAMRCCRVPQDTGQTVTLSAATPSPEPVTAWVTATGDAFPVSAGVFTARTATAGCCRAGPIFLQTRSLRL